VSIFPAGATPSGPPRWVLPALWAIVAVLVIDGVLLPLLSAGPAPSGVRHRVIEWHSFQVPTFSPGCATKAPTAGSVTSVPMEIVRSGSLTFEYVPVCLEGHGPYPFILDTGASVSTVDTALARSLRLSSAGSPSFGFGANCGALFQPMDLTQWSVGSLPLDPQVVQAISVPGFGTSDAPAGLLGSDVLSRFGSARLDFIAGELRVVGTESAGVGGTTQDEGQAAAVLADGETHTDVRLLVIRSSDSVITVVQVLIGGFLQPFVLDTGAGRSAADPQTVTTGSLKDSGVREMVPSIGCVRSVPLVGSRTWSVKTTSGNLPLRPQLLLEVTLPPEFAGALGSDVLRRFGWIVIDYQHQLLLLGGRQHLALGLGPSAPPVASVPPRVGTWHRMGAAGVRPDRQRLLAGANLWLRSAGATPRRDASRSGCCGQLGGGSVIAWHPGHGVTGRPHPPSALGRSGRGRASGGVPMETAMFEWSDVKRLATHLEQVCGDLDERDQSVLRAIFALAGAAAAEGRDEVSGFSFGAVTVGLGGDTLVDSFQWGVGRAGTADESGPSIVHRLGGAL
jgi:hypothetical protein